MSNVQNDARKIFEGLRIIDFSWVGVGPMAAQTFALFGAEVIRVESSKSLDIFRIGGPLAPGDGPDRSAYWANINRDKKAMTLDLKHPNASEVVKRLVSDADIVTESFRPGVMRSAGFDYDSLSQENPELIMISMSMEGQGGPHAGFKGFGLTLQATAGITGLTGWPDRAPVGTGVAYTDWFSTHLAVTSLIAALEHRDLTGEGQYIDLSQLEAMIWGLDDAVLRFTAGEQVMSADGNRDPNACPHGVFKCLGDDEWIAISIFSDSQWLSFRKFLGDPDWAMKSDYLTFEGRKENEDDLDRLITNWTIEKDPEKLAEEMQELGVPAYKVADAKALYDDPQLDFRDHFWEIEHKVIGPMTWDSPAYKLSGTPAYPKEPAPLLGEHTKFICTELLGYSEEEFTELLISGVLD
ncbi:MAG: CoA transferase [Dehalococcoidia bacterium]|nr:CoA transferase [Dehalococcoidia bacterium]